VIRQDAGVRTAIIVNGPPGSGKSTLAVPLATALDLPLLAKDAVKETLLDNLSFANRDDSRRLGAAAGEVLWTVLAGCPRGAVIESWLAPHTRDLVTAGLTRAGVDQIVEIWCQCRPEEARRRYEGRIPDRHPGHFDESLVPDIDQVINTAGPLRLGPVIEVSTDHPVDLNQLLAEIQERTHS
jgi:predicted kinase